MPYSSTASLRHVHGSPVLRLLRRLRPPRETSPDWAACRASRARRSREVPWFKRLTLDAVGGQLYPWLRGPNTVSGQGVGTSMTDARSRQKIDQPRSGSVPAGAGYVSVQRLPSPTSGERKHRPLVFTMASAVARLGATRAPCGQFRPFGFCRPPFPSWRRSRPPSAPGPTRARTTSLGHRSTS
jgi:hypothetical protein